jgi:hypothetical protein
MRLLQAMLFFALAATVGTAHALTVGNYKAELKSNQSRLNIYINGVGEGLSWANTMNQAKDLPLIYCQPRKLVMNVENFKTIIEDELEKYPEVYKDDIPIELVLARGLVRTFPCTS